MNQKLNLLSINCKFLIIRLFYPNIKWKVSTGLLRKEWIKNWSIWGVGYFLVEIHKLLCLSVFEIKQGSIEYNIMSLRLAYKILKNKYVIFGITSKAGRLSFKFLVVEIIEEILLKYKSGAEEGGGEIIQYVEQKKYDLLLQPFLYKYSIGS